MFTTHRNYRCQMLQKLVWHIELHHHREMLDYTSERNVFVLDNHQDNLCKNHLREKNHSQNEMKEEEKNKLTKPFLNFFYGHSSSRF